MISPHIPSASQPTLNQVTAPKFHPAPLPTEDNPRRPMLGRVVLTNSSEQLPRSPCPISFQGGPACLCLVPPILKPSIPVWSQPCLRRTFLRVNLRTQDPNQQQNIVDEFEGRSCRAPRLSQALGTLINSIILVAASDTQGRMQRVIFQKQHTTRW